MVRQGNIEVCSLMNLSASFDHRVTVGYDGAQLKQLLEQPATILYRPARWKGRYRSG
ncbi:2-oxo acid dehydrogenase subunit E2 [Kineobactrum salinum]|uniref:2-oxo acid dehydrogenase subunit E2 n=1 Tax=Kineobactrum salinum TaxID=2708301 RepID=UPI0018D8784A